jgi:alpha-ketoglutarate-dependent taurine dioxygenase
MSMRITPIDATFGAVITGIDLGQLDDATWAAVHAAFLEYGVLVFPAQHLTEEAQESFARRLGPAEKLSPRQSGHTLIFTNRKPDGSLAQPHEQQYQILKGNEGWHTDSTYMPIASKAAMLSALVLPSEGGETEFADMRAAWDALDSALQAKLEGLSAYHSLYYSQARAGFSHRTDNIYGFHDKGAPLRPLVKVHPETGRKSLYVARHAYGIPGMDPEASEALLQQLIDDACQPPRTYLHTWAVGDLVLWDNRCMLHRARPYDVNQARVLRASRISGAMETEFAPAHADERAAAYVPSTSNLSSRAV